MKSKCMVAALLLLPQAVMAEVTEYNLPGGFYQVMVEDDPWKPEGFEHGAYVPVTWLSDPEVLIDGADDEKAWQRALEIEVPLSHGSVAKAWVKAVYSNDDIYIRVRWQDETEDRDYRPWVWDAKSAAYVEGTQVDDSVLLSFEAGCEWSPSMLSGYAFDFDGWLWQAGRTDSTGKALDVLGNTKDNETRFPGFVGYSSRVTEDAWILKFLDPRDGIMHRDLEELKRVYMWQVAYDTTFVRMILDGHSPREQTYLHSEPAPEANSESPVPMVPQYSPIPLSEQASEVDAKGEWKDGYWTVEYKRALVTPAGIANDTVFERITQFSLHVWDSSERIDETSESDRLLLKFLPREQQVARE